jgi:hypothetical protein
MGTALLSVALGLGLAAACGFRVFVPLLALGAAAHTGYVPLTPGFAWVATTPALLALGSATLLEVAAYYVPWLDHALDLLATPAAVVAGILVSASVVTDLPPLLRWAVVLIGGGGAAGLVQGATVLARAKSGMLTAGLANPIVATVELVAAALVSLIAIVLPLLCLAVVLSGCIFIFRSARRLAFGRRARPTLETS